MSLLSAPEALDLELSFGGKINGLLRLRHRFPVPDFCVMSHSQEHDHPVQVQEVISLIGNPPWAVRSSASVEDTAGSPFAGMFSSVLGVAADDLSAAIHHVLDSARSPRVAAYAEAKGINSDDIEMFVVIQKMVDARVAGVALTASASGASDTIVEAVFGLGEVLVSGHVAPDHYEFSTSADSIQTVQVTRQTRQLVMSGTAPPTVMPVPNTRQYAQKLRDGEVREVSHLAHNVEEALGVTGVDVEFAYEADRLYLLQARPLAAV